MMFNPIYRNRAIRPGEVAGKKYSDAFIRLVSVAEDVIGARHRGELEERRHLKDRVTIAEQELATARRQATALGEREQDRP
jgi:hypothetical protein